MNNLAPTREDTIIVRPIANEEQAREVRRVAHRVRRPRDDRCEGLEGMGVVVEGRYGRDGLFTSTSLMVKHSNEYRAPKAGERPKEMYKTLIKGSG